MTLYVDMVVSPTAFLTGLFESVILSGKRSNVAFFLRDAEF